MTDPLQPLLDLPGVGDAADRARDALAAAHRHRANLRGWPTTAAEASLRAARASATIDGAGSDLADPKLASALRVAQGIDGLVATWSRAPLQALAKLHVLAAGDLVDDAELGRPRESSARLDLLAQLVTGGTNAPAPVVAAIVHGELLALGLFAPVDGVIARAASRLVSVASGLDPHNLGVPEVLWMRRAQAYRDGARGFAGGTVQGVGGWILFCCAAFEAGAQEATAIADTAVNK